LEGKGPKKQHLFALPLHHHHHLMTGHPQLFEAASDPVFH